MADNEYGFETGYGRVTLMNKKKKDPLHWADTKHKAKVWWGKHKCDVKFGIGIGCIALGAYGMGRLVGALKSIENCEFTQVTDNDEGFILHAVLDKEELAKAGLENNYQIILKRFEDAITDVNTIDI